MSKGGHRAPIVHFGIRLRRPVCDLRLNKRNFIYRTKRGRYIYKDRWLRSSGRFAQAAHRADCLRNYDLSKRYYAALDRAAFDGMMERMLERFPMLGEVRDINDLDGVRGVYVMVLGRHCQVYVGKSSSKHGIRRRIMRHWTNKVPFDRLLSGAADESIITIDSFGPLDTTRILACSTDDPSSLESELVDYIPIMFSANRTAGGDLDGGLHEAIERRRTRPLTASCGAEALWPMTS